MTNEKKRTDPRKTEYNGVIYFWRCKKDLNFFLIKRDTMLVCSYVDNDDDDDYDYYYCTVFMD